MSSSRQSLIKPPATVIPTKRNSLGNVTNNIMNQEHNLEQKDTNLPKPSSIPRPNTTPTKTSSYLTPYGYRSPSSPARSKSATPEATRTNSEPLAFHHNSDLKKEIRVKPNTSFTRRELENLKEQIEDREKEFTEVKNSILTLKTSKQQIEFDNYGLEERLSCLNKELKIKGNMIEHLNKRNEDVRTEIQRDYELKLKQMRVENEACMYEIEKNYKNEIERVLSVKVSNIQKQKSRLQEKVSALNGDIQNNEVNFQEDLATIRKQYDQKRVDLGAFMQDTRNSLGEELKILHSRKADYEQKIKKCEETSQKEQEEKKKQAKELQEATLLTEEAELQFETLQKSLQDMKASLAEKSSMIEQLKVDIEFKNSQRNMFNQQLIEEEVVRRKLHNKMQELKGNIRVFCRIRPPLGSEADDVFSVQVPDNDEEEQEIVLKDPKPTSSGYLGNPSACNNNKFYNFSFDRVFQTDSTNQEIFEEISQLVQSSLDGFNVCIFAYGQTGSGKTHTMSNSDGMIPRAVDQIFETANKLRERGWTYKIYGEFLEIYNENINDLLGDPNNIDKVKFEIRHDAVNQKTSVSELTSIELTDPKMVSNVLQKALKNRSIAATKANERSSRSHSVFTIKIHGVNGMTNEKSEGTLNLIDLAGSERLSHSQAIGDRLKETQSINKSLSCLGDVIYALGDSKDVRKHIPFRNSKLTYLLQYSLGGNSKTLMFVNISPFNKHFNETINSLRFATKVNSTKIGTAKKNTT